MSERTTILTQAIHLFLVIGGWLVAPLVGGWLVGTWLDSHYQTKPWLLLASLGAAFIVTNAGLVIEMKKYLKQLDNIKKPLK